jgi:hypothetical protein
LGPWGLRIQLGLGFRAIPDLWCIWWVPCFVFLAPPTPIMAWGRTKVAAAIFPSRLAILTARQSALLHCMRQGLLSTVVSNAFGQTRLSCQ